MAVSNTILLELLGKQVSFCWLGADGVTYEIDGQLTSVFFILSLHQSLLLMMVTILVLTRSQNFRF